MLLEFQNKTNFEINGLCLQTLNADFLCTYLDLLDIDILFSRYIKSQQIFNGIVFGTSKQAN